MPCYLNILDNERSLSSPPHLESAVTGGGPPEEPIDKGEASMPRSAQVKSASETPESSVAGSPDTESPVLVNEYVCITHTACSPGPVSFLSLSLPNKLGHDMWNPDHRCHGRVVRIALALMSAA